MNSNNYLEASISINESQTHILSSNGGKLHIMEKDPMPYISKMDIFSSNISQQIQNEETLDVNHLLSIPPNESIEKTSGSIHENSFDHLNENPLNKSGKKRWSKLSLFLKAVNGFKNEDVMKISEVEFFL